MFPTILQTLALARSNFNPTQSPRLPQLQRLAAWLRAEREAGHPLRLTVICTQNSRRSFLGQFWAQAAASAAGIVLKAYSGGTEATAIHPHTRAALERAGARIILLQDGANPRYRIAYGDGETDSFEAWSKVYDDPANPTAAFAVITVCTEADGACPIVPGAAARFALPYDDPKHADGTPTQNAAYNATSHTIAAELAWVMEQL